MSRPPWAAEKVPPIWRSPCSIRRKRLLSGKAFAKKETSPTLEQRAVSSGPLRIGEVCCMNPFAILFSNGNSHVLSTSGHASLPDDAFFDRAYRSFLSENGIKRRSRARGSRRGYRRHHAGMLSHLHPLKHGIQRQTVQPALHLRRTQRRSFWPGQGLLRRCNTARPDHIRQKRLQRSSRLREE